MSRPLHLIRKEFEGFEIDPAFAEPEQPRERRIGDTLPDFDAISSRQIARARELIYEDYENCPSLGWESVHEAVGYKILPHQLWTAAAVSGHGKTTAAMSVVRYNIEAGKKVFVVPTEQSTDVCRVYLAALSLGLDTRLALANRWKKLPKSAQDAVNSELVRQDDEKELLHFSDVDFLTVKGMPKILEHAALFGADLVVVDHVHNIRSNGGHPAGEFATLCQTLYSFSKDARIPILALAQMHKGTVRDRVRPYLPPDVEMIQMGDVLRQASAVVLGLFRPLNDWVGAKEHALIRMGEPIKPYLKPSTMAVALLKNRVGGSEGEVIDLDYWHGSVKDSASWTPNA